MHVSFVTIHPFFDGNGRMARLVSNIPVLKSGYPPILISLDRRKNYIDALVRYQLEFGLPAVDKDLIQQGDSLEGFKAFCFKHWRQSLDLVDRSHQRQAERHEGDKKK